MPAIKTEKLLHMFVLMQKVSWPLIILAFAMLVVVFAIGPGKLNRVSGGPLAATLLGTALFFHCIVLAAWWGPALLGAQTPN